jgi:hypothetical protein
MYKVYYFTSDYNTRQISDIMVSLCDRENTLAANCNHLYKSGLVGITGLEYIQPDTGCYIYKTINKQGNNDSIFIPFGCGLTTRIVDHSFSGIPSPPFGLNTGRTYYALSKEELMDYHEKEPRRVQKMVNDSKKFFHKDI